MIGICLVEENLVVNAVNLFKDQDEFELTPIALELKDLRLPRRGYKMIDCTEVYGENYLSYRFAPNEKILDIIKENAEDSEPDFFIKHYFVNLRMAFATTDILDSNQRNYEKLCKRYEIEAVPEVDIKIFPIFKESGFKNKQQYAQFLQEVSYKSGNNLEEHGIIKSMVRE